MSATHLASVALEEDDDPIRIALQDSARLLVEEIAYLRTALEQDPDKAVMHRINRAAATAASLNAIDLRIKLAGLSKIKKWTPTEKRQYFLRWFRGLPISERASLLSELQAG